MLVPRDQVKDGEKYYVTQDGWIDLGGGNKEYIGTKFMSPSTKEGLSQESLDSNKALLDLFCVPVVCEVRNGSVFTKNVDEQVKITMLQLLNISDAPNPVSMFSLQDHKDILLGYINGLESLFPTQESDEDQDKITQMLNILYTDIEQILDVHTETDSKDDTLDKIETRLRNFLLIIPHDVHANITLETDGSLHHVLIEARNYLDKKFNVQDEIADDVDQELENEIIRQNNYDNAMISLKNNIYNLNTIFFDTPGYNPEKIDERVLSLADGIIRLISSCKKYPELDQERKLIHLTLTDLFEEFRESIKTDYLGGVSIERTRTSYRNNMSGIDHCMYDVLYFKNYNDILYIGPGSLSAKGLFDKLLEYAESTDEENITNSLDALQQYPDEEISDLLNKKELEELLKIVLDKEDYIFAAKIRDIIKSKQ